jgi:hypothetical protein
MIADSDATMTPFVINFSWQLDLLSGGRDEQNG